LILILILGFGFAEEDPWVN